VTTGPPGSPEPPGPAGIAPVFGPGSRQLVNDFLRAHHYLGPVPGFVRAFALGAADPVAAEEITGVVVLGTPCSIVLMRRGFLEVRRAAFVRGVADADVLRMLRTAIEWTMFSRYSALVAYADPDGGAGCPCDADAGRLYREAGFELDGTTKPHPKGWGEYRPSGKASYNGQKLRFVLTFSPFGTGGAL
jgi:hypothetical protein